MVKHVFAPAWESTAEGECIAVGYVGEGMKPSTIILVCAAGMGFVLAYLFILYKGSVV